MMLRTYLALLLGLSLVACGSKSNNPAAPSPNPAPSPTQQSVSLTGTVSAQSGQRLNGATVTILDGASVRTYTVGSATRVIC